MRLPQFEYVAPRTVSEACSLLARYRGKARLIAGGTDLLVRMKNGEVAPQYLVGLNGIAGLNHIRYERGKGLRLGALVSLKSLATSPVVKERCSFLAGAAGMMATPQVRNLGTLGGNLCNAAPSADTAPPLIASGATAKILGEQVEREVKLERFFTGPGKTVLRAGEILTEVVVPLAPAHSGQVYLKLFPRSAVDIAAVGVAVQLVREPRRDVCRDIVIVLGAVAPTPIRAKRAERLVKGKKLEEGLIQEAAQMALEEARPISDVRASEWYRREMVKVLTVQALRKAWEQAGA